MLPELLLLLAGHPSSLVSPSPPDQPTSYVLSSAYASHFHPGEVASINTLALLAFRFNKVSSWVARAQARAREEILRGSVPSPPRSDDGKAVGDDGGAENWQYLAAMCSRLRGVLQEYEALLVQTEERVLRRDERLVGEVEGFVPLAILLATFAPWYATMASLSILVDTLQAGPPYKFSSSKPTAQLPLSQPSSSSPPIPIWPPGPLITLLHNLHLTSYSDLSTMYLHLCHSVQLTFISQLLVFLLHGLPCSLAFDSGPDPLALHRRTYALRSGAMPDLIGTEVRESVLWVGRAVAVVRREGRELPRDMRTRLERAVRGVWFEDEREFKEAIERVRGEVGEWLWRNILTKKDVKQAIESFGDIFLHRDGELALAFVREVEDLKLSKLVRSNASASSSIIREQDINLALLRASVGTSSSTDPALEQLRFVLEKGPLRPFLPPVASTSSLSASTTLRPSPVSLPPTSAALKLFSSHLLGTPLTLTSTLSWPLDLFLTPPALLAYSSIFAYLTALRRTHTRVLGCWLSLSGAQRTRMKWTGVGEGGEEGRKKVARLGWGVVRLMVWFLDSIMSHFQTDVIDVQHRALLAKLQNASTSSTLSSSTLNRNVTADPTTLRTPHGNPSGFQRASSPGPSPSTSAPASPTNTHASIVQLQPRFPASTSSRSQSPLFQTSSSAFPPPAPSTTHFSASQTARTSPHPPPSPTSANSPTPVLDFLTLRNLHSNYLSVLQEGLLLSNPAMSQTIKDVLDVCEHFVGMVERWGGDVLPGLLEVEVYDDENGTEGNRSMGREVERRGEVVREIRDSLESSFSTFFSLLTPSSTPTFHSNPLNSFTSTHAPDASFAALTLGTNPNGSFVTGSRYASYSGGGSRHVSGGGARGRAGLTVGGSAEDAARELEADVASRRHLEQLALRLDFLGTWFGGRRGGRAGEEEGEEGKEGMGEE